MFDFSGVRPGGVLTHVLGVTYVASAPLVFRSCGLDSVALGFVEMFWILGEKGCFAEGVETGAAGIGETLWAMWRQRS